jgi:ketosteroid isomerase-like protein
MLGEHPRQRTVRWFAAEKNRLNSTVPRWEEFMAWLGRSTVLTLVLCAVALPALGQTKAVEEVTALLREFMQAAGTGDRAVFDKFFADDLIYTRATGVLITKADIMQSLGKPAAQSSGKTTYSAEDITVHEYGETVVIAFRLEGRTELPDGKVELGHYRNTGTFVRRNGRWQAVAWQATKIAPSGNP